ncbi:hypothetical protein [Synechococcus sp. UW140]|uniref:hypothetical protein n=1 Tax=Synechococcus sp. UW140 TaxID=368503 RepID=UPI0025E973F1|nr:hypothetical protein [Synechococcus sp. UW140]
MAIIPRWRFMSDDAKAITKCTAISAVAVVLALLIFRGLLPWIFGGLVAWWVWKAINK